MNGRGSRGTPAAAARRGASPGARWRGASPGDQVALPVFVLLAAAAAVMSPSLAGPLTEVAVVALVGLSLDVSVRRLGTPALPQAGVLAAAAWLTGMLLARHQSPVVALAAAALLGGLLAPVVLLAPGPRPKAGLAAGSLALSAGLAAVVPAVPLFAPPVLVGIALGTPRGALGSALAALLLGGWLTRALLHGELARWLAAAREAPDIVARGGVDPAAVRAAGLAVSGVLAGLAGWAAAVATLGGPSARPVDPALALAWLAIPLVGGPGPLGAVAGAALFVGATKFAGAADLSVLVIAGPVVAWLLWREPARSRGLQDGARGQGDGVARGHGDDAREGAP